MLEKFCKEFLAYPTTSGAFAVLVILCFTPGEASDEPVDDHVRRTAVERDHVFSRAVTPEERHVGDSTEILYGTRPVIETREEDIVEERAQRSALASERMSLGRRSPTTRPRSAPQRPRARRPPCARSSVRPHARRWHE